MLSLLQIVLYKWIFLFWIFCAFNFGSAYTLMVGIATEEAHNREQGEAAAHISCSVSNAVKEMTPAQAGLLSMEMVQKLTTSY